MSVIEKIRRELKKNGDEKTREGGRRFFKENIELYGVKTAVVSRIGKEWFETVKGLGKSEIFALCDELWRSGYMEESFIACNWAHFVRKDFAPDDFSVFEKWVGEYVGNWASCDTLCNHTVGAFLEAFPEFLPQLERWARSKNRWMRRAAAVSLIVPARRGKFLDEIFKIADILLADRDDMVRKGYGWMLKVASQTHLEEVFGYVVKNKSEMPRTALRYAIEKMPDAMRKKAMEK